MRKPSWLRHDLERAVSKSKSIRQVLAQLGLKPAGGNYEQVKKYISLYRINTTHFTGQAWNKGKRGIKRSQTPLSNILKKESPYQSYKLKKRLIQEGLKKAACELCGWSKKCLDGRIPVELDHINGDRHDNRLENLRVLCPNCHSLQPTHRGKNKRSSGGTGIRAALKML